MAREVIVDPVEAERREEIDRSREVESTPKRDWVEPGDRLIQKGAWFAERVAIGSALATTTKKLQHHPDLLIIFSVCTALLIGAIHSKSFKAHRIWFSLSLIMIVATGSAVYWYEQKNPVPVAQKPSTIAGKVSPHSLGQGLKPGH